MSCRSHSDQQPFALTQRSGNDSFDDCEPFTSTLRTCILIYFADIQALADHTSGAASRGRLVHEMSCISAYSGWESGLGVAFQVVICDATISNAGLMRYHHEQQMACGFQR